MAWRVLTWSSRLVGVAMQQAADAADHLVHLARQAGSLACGHLGVSLQARIPTSQKGISSVYLSIYLSVYMRLGSHEASTSGRCLLLRITAFNA